MRYQSRVAHRYSEFKFRSKPPEPIRSILKSYGYRWSPHSGVWWVQRASGYADCCVAIDAYFRILNGTPDGKCWECQSPNGFFRNHGASTAVYCNDCHAKHNQPAPYIDVDRLYEDSCAEQCGL